MQSVLEFNAKKTGESTRMQSSQGPWNTPDHLFHEAPAKRRTHRGNQYPLSSAESLGRTGERPTQALDSGKSDDEYGFNYFVAADDLDAALAWPV